MRRLILTVALLLAPIALAEAQSGEVTLSSGHKLSGELVELMIQDNLLTHRAVDMVMETMQCMEAALEEDVDWTWQQCRTRAMPILRKLIDEHSLLEARLLEIAHRRQS